MQLTHGFLSHLTAALLAVHTVLGCCSHHAHACGRECQPVSSVESPDSDASHDAGRCTTQDSDSHQNHGLRDCQGSRCVFFSPAKGDLNAALQHSLPSCIYAESGDLSLRAAAASRLPLAADALLPPLRLHLAYQVLLL